MLLLNLAFNHFSGLAAGVGLQAEIDRTAGSLLPFVPAPASLRRSRSCLWCGFGLAPLVLPGWSLMSGGVGS